MVSIVIEGYVTQSLNSTVPNGTPIKIVFTSADPKIVFQDSSSVSAGVTQTWTATVTIGSFTYSVPVRESSSGSFSLIDQYPSEGGGYDRLQFQLNSDFRGPDMMDQVDVDIWVDVVPRLDWIDLTPFSGEARVVIDAANQLAAIGFIQILHHQGSESVQYNVNFNVTSVTVSFPEAAASTGEPLFTAQNDVVDFNALDPDDYRLPAANSLAGDDQIVLPQSASGLTAWGLQAGFHGGEGNDTITAGVTSVIVYGDAGNDTLKGGAGQDVLDGGEGNDILYHYSGNAGDDLSADVLLGGAGSDAFLIGHGDTIEDAEAGEIITLDGALNTDLFYLSEADIDGRVMLRALQRIEGGFQVIGEAIIRSDLPQVAFAFHRTDGQTSLTVEGRASETPQDWLDTCREKVDLLVAPAFDSFKIAAGKLAVEYAQDQAEDLALKVMVSMVAAGAVFLGAPSILIGGALVLTRTEIGNTILDLTRVAIHEARGDYADGELGEAIATAVSPTLDQLVLRAKLEHASAPLLDAIATTITSTIGSALDDGAAKFAARGLLHPDSEGAIIGTSVEDVILGTGEGTRLIGYGGNDILIGGSRADIADYGSAVRGVFVDLNAQTATDLPPPPSSSQLGALAAPNGDLIGTDALIEIHNVAGSAWNDILAGSGSADILSGAAGADRLNGGRGADRLFGGSGADIFVFGQVGDSRPLALRSDGGKIRPDLIGDFVSGVDRIDLSAIDARTGGVDDAFTFIGSAAFSGQSGQLRYAGSGGMVRIMGDIDGDARADFEILATTPAIQATDFIL